MANKTKRTQLVDLAQDAQALSATEMEQVQGGTSNLNLSKSNINAPAPTTTTTRITTVGTSTPVAAATTVKGSKSNTSE